MFTWFTNWAFMISCIKVQLEAAVAFSNSNFLRPKLISLFCSNYSYLFIYLFSYLFIYLFNPFLHPVPFLSFFSLRYSRLSWSSRYPDLSHCTQFPSWSEERTAKSIAKLTFKQVGFQSRGFRRPVMLFLLLWLFLLDSWCWQLL